MASLSVIWSFKWPELLLTVQQLRNEAQAEAVLVHRLQGGVVAQVQQRLRVVVYRYLLVR